MASGFCETKKADVLNQELARSRAFLLLVKSDFVAVYKQTVLGQLWFLFNAFLASLVFTLLCRQRVRLLKDARLFSDQEAKPLAVSRRFCLKPPHSLCFPHQKNRLACRWWKSWLGAAR
jgi:hypothetical protein